jgi:hypothetical protein
MVQANTFSGKAYKDDSAHLQNFLEISSTIVKDIAQDVYYFLCFCSHWGKE